MSVILSAITESPVTMASDRMKPPMLIMPFVSLPYESTIPKPTMVDMVSIAIMKIMPSWLLNLPKVSLSGRVSATGRLVLSKAK